jgi:hypothetical protein
MQGPIRKIMLVQSERGGRRKGQKGHFPTVLSRQKQEMNILLVVVSRSKFNNNHSVHQQTAPHFECPIANFA